MSHFLSNNNKALIWQLLSENHAFENIDNSNFERVRTLCDDKFKETSNIKNITLTEQNKIVISKIMKDLLYLKSQTVHPTSTRG